MLLTRPNSQRDVRACIEQGCEAPGVAANGRRRRVREIVARIVDVAIAVGKIVLVDGCANDRQRGTFWVLRYPAAE